MARAAPRVRHARRAVVTDGVHSRAQGLAVQIPDDVWMHHILWRREAPPPGAGDGRPSPPTTVQLISGARPHHHQFQVNQWALDEKEAILLTLSMRAVNRSFKRVVEKEMMCRMMKMAYGEGAKLVQNPARMTNVFLGLKLEWARESANFFGKCYSCGHCWCHDDRRCSLLRSHENYFGGSLTSSALTHRFDLSFAQNAPENFAAASIAAARLCELHFQQERYRTDMEHVYNFAKQMAPLWGWEQRQHFCSCFVISLVKVLIRFIVFLFEWDRKDKLLWKMAIEVLYILIDCLEQDRHDHFAAWIIFFHEKAAKHNAFPFAVLTSLNSSFENVEGKKCLALLLGHIVRKQEEALRFFETGICYCHTDLEEDLLERWRYTCGDSSRICLEKTGKIMPSWDVFTEAHEPLHVLGPKYTLDRRKCEVWFRNDYSRFLEAGCLDFAIEIAVTCMDFVGWGTHGTFFAIDVGETTWHECSFLFGSLDRHEGFPVRYVARDLLDFAMLHSRKHASKRMMAKIHQARARGARARVQSARFPRFGLAILHASSWAR